MNSQDNSQWILECRLGTRSGDLIGELRNGRLVYDNISRNFEAYHYTVKHELKQKAKFSIDQVFLEKPECVNGRNYLIKVGRPLIQELRIVDLNKPDKEKLHALLLREVGVRKGSQATPVSKLQLFRSASMDTSKMKREENDAGMAQLRASTNYSDHRHRSSQRPQQNRTPLGNLPGNAANFRTSVVEDPIIEDKPFSAPRQTGSLLARKRTSNQPSVEFQPRISSLTTPARFTNVTERRPKPHVWPSRPDAYVSSRTAVEKPHENKDKFYRYDYRNQNVLNNVLDSTFASLSPQQATSTPHFESTLNELEDRPVRPDSPITEDLKHPENWDELPPQFYRKDFWQKLPTMKGLRSGTLGEWVKGLDERLTVEGLLTLRDHEWLNADSIDAYLRFICQHIDGDQVVQFMPTYSILSYEYKGKIPSKWYWDLKGVDIILAPAHLKNSHWAMGVIDVKARSLTLMDSLNHGFTTEAKRTYMATVIKMLDEIVEQQGLQEDFPGEWRTSENFDVPQQVGGYDCGVFSLLFATYSARRKPFDFEQQHIRFFRRQICYDLISEIVNAMYEQQEYEEVQVDESENCNKVTKLSALDEIDEAVIPLN